MRSQPSDTGRVIAPGVVAGRWWHLLEGGKLQCDLCPRECRLSEGQRGFCFVREARGGQIVLTSYGRASGFCVDPIEKKPLNHFYPGTSVLSFGTAGCNLGCRFCQNWDISKAREADRLNDWAAPEAVARAAARAQCVSVAFTYNDPVIFAEYAIDCARACHDLGVKTVAVTAGYINAQARAEFFSVMDAANVDLKAFTERFYQKLCFGHLDPVLETLRYLKLESAVWFEVTTLLIPDENDSADEIARLCDWYVQNLGPDVPLHFSAFHADFKLLGHAHTPASTLARARSQALAAGIKHVYTGNVYDPAGQSTYCPGCGRPVIERDGYTLGNYQVTADGRCELCSTPISGRFAKEPGNWGSRRLRVRVGS
jgi:pyruvate formate lyase activating enzyme